MRLSVLLFDGFTALDIVGGYEVLFRLPGVQLEFAARERALVAADSGALGLMATTAFEEVADTDILYVPGGPGVAAAMQDQALLDFVRRVAPRAKWIFAVCNGTGILGAAGLLKGRTVTTNWFAREAVAAWGATVLNVRYVRDGALVTGAGVSSSIDAALFLAGEICGEAVARTIQLGIEYYPAPPFGNGTPDSQPQAMQAMVASAERHGARQLAARRIPFPHLTPGAGPTAATPDT